MKDFGRKGAGPAFVLAGESGIGSSVFNGVVKILNEVLDDLGILALQIPALRGISSQMEQLDRRKAFILERLGGPGVRPATGTGTQAELPQSLSDRKGPID